MQFKNGDIVWVDLGVSYGWWPAEYQTDPNLKMKNFDAKTNPKTPLNGNKENSNANKNEKKPILGCARFFDDDKFDLLRITNEAILKSYSCKEKKDLVLKGLAKFEMKKKSNSMFDYRARQAQFYKDVEMAEVMTDNDPTIADVLAQYEVMDDLQNNETQEPETKPPPKKRRKGKQKR